jgi:predicted dehydrogenase
MKEALAARGAKVALVGLGYWGPNLLRSLAAMAGAEHVVVVDQSVERVAVACAQYPATTGCSSLDEALESHNVWATIIATPVSTHHDLVRTALDAGSHVLVEKPLARSVAEAADLVLHAERSNRTLMVGHTFLFSPRVELIERLVRDGRLGAIQYVTSARLNLGLHQSDVSVIWDLAPHDLSIILRVLGEVPTRIRTTGRAMVRPNRPDVAFLQLDFPSGVVASVSLSWLAPSKARNTVIVGDKQMLVYDDLQAEQPIRLYDKGITLNDPDNFGEHQLTYRHGDVLAPHVPAREPLAQEVAHFLDCCEDAGPCRSDARFGLDVVRCLEAAEASWFEDGEAVWVVDGEAAAGLRVVAAT